MDSATMGEEGGEWGGGRALRLAQERRRLQVARQADRSRVDGVDRPLIFGKTMNNIRLEVEDDSQLSDLNHAAQKIN